MREGQYIRKRNLIEKVTQYCVCVYSICFCFCFFFNWLQEMQQKGARTWRKLDKLEEKKYDHFRPLFFGPGQL